MQRQVLLAAGLALANVANVAGQTAAITTNPLNNFIGAAGAAASAINSANAQETSLSSSSTTSPSTTSTPPPAATPSHSATAASGGLSKGAKIGIIIGCIIAAVLILAILAGICCCLVRRRRRNRRRTVAPVEKEGSPKPWKSPINPGRHYSNYTPAQRGEVPMDHHPTVPLMAAAATDHHTHAEKTPSLSQHPAMRPQPQNPFVPVPPSPRRTEPNHRSNGVTDGLVAGTAAGAGAYAMHEHHNRHSKSSSSPSTMRPQSGAVLPTHYDPNRPPTPFGLSGFGNPSQATTSHPPRTSSPPYASVGQPYNDMHVHVLQTDAPSRELRHSLQKHEENPFPAAATYASDPNHPTYRNSKGYSTPPEVPSRSPNRRSAFADSSYDSSLSTTTNSADSGYGRQPDPYGPAQRESIQPWQQHQQRFSDATVPPPVPWEQDNTARRQSHSPRQSESWERRRGSRSPAVSINGQPRRLRFEDLTPPGAVRGAGHESWDGHTYGNEQRWSQGVGEAL